MVLPGDAEFKPDAIGKSLRGKAYHTVVGTFVRQEKVDPALEALRRAGFSEQDMWVVSRGSEAADEIPSQAASEKATNIGWFATILGSLAGAVLGWLLAGLFLGIPGISPLLVIIGGGLVGAAAGNWIGTMVLNVPKEVEESYGPESQPNGDVVMVLAHEGEREETAQRILQEAGADQTDAFPYQVRPGEFPGSRARPAHHQA